MKTISVPEIVGQIEGYLARRYAYEVVRSFVFSRYEAEEQLIVTPGADEVLSVLAPYMETEEFIADLKKDIRLSRLARLLTDTRGLPASALSVLALKYDEIALLLKKRREHLIAPDVCREQVRKLSPAKFDVDRVLEWAEKLHGEREPRIETIA
jgi:hypothetical protein